MLALLREGDRLLRGRAGEADEVALPPPTLLLAMIVGGGMLYGAVMGAFGLEDARPLQVLYSAVKVPLLLAATFAVTVPVFFVLNTLMGLREDFGAAIRALLTTQAGLAIVLVSLAPFTAVWYASSDYYPAAPLFNALMFGVASVSAQWLLRREYRPLIQRDPRHRAVLRMWIIVYAFVGVEMGWVLRPFIGVPNRPTQFFREDSFGNAYVIIGNMIWRVITGG